MRLRKTASPMHISLLARAVSARHQRHGFWRSHSIAGKEKIALESAAAHAIARGAEGGLRDAESMLDQLVAFCGEKISENDVLDVFGFTSEQTVADLTGRILQGETPGAIDLLHQQSDAGKDMMRLMSDLIAYLRDLLIFKAKPDALKEDVEPDVQTSLARH